MQEEKRAIWLKNNRKNSTDYENTAWEKSNMEWLWHEKNVQHEKSAIRNLYNLKRVQHGRVEVVFRTKSNVNDETFLPLTIFAK